MKPWLRAMRWVGVGALVVVLLLGAAWLALPGLIKNQVEQRGQAALGRALRVGEVTVQPWKLAFTLNKLVLSAPAGSNLKEPQASIERVRLDLDWHSLLRLAPIAEAVDIQSPKLRLARVAEGRYDIDDILERLRPDPQAKPGTTANFALYNLNLRGGEIRFDDKPVARQQRLTKLNISLPFLSNLPADLEVNVQPRVSFLLNGAAFDSGAEGTPFAQARQADLTLRFDGYPLEPLQAYLPQDLHLKPQRGKLDGQLALRFTQDDDGSRVTLRGELTARDVRVLGAGGQPVLSWQALKLGLNEVRPLERRVALGLVRVEGLVAELRRDAGGRLNLLPPVSATAASGPEAAPPGARSEKWSVQADKVELVGAQLQWLDESVRPAVALRARAVDLRLGALSWPLDAPVDVKLAAEMVQGDRSLPAGRIVAEGSVSADNAALALELSDLVLDPANPYFAPALALRLEGRLSAVGQWQWSQGEAPRNKLRLGTLKLADVRLIEANAARTAPAGLRQLDLADIDIDWLAQTASATKANLVQPSLSLLRDSDGHWNAARWWRGGRAAAPARTGAAPASASLAGAPAAAKDWRLDLRELKVDNGRLRLFDALQGDPPTLLDLDNVKLSAQALRWPADPKAAPGAASLSARLLHQGAGGDSRSGSLDWRGKFSPSPLHAEGQLLAERLPLAALQPYVSGLAPWQVERGEGGFSGELNLRQDDKGLTLLAQGDASLDDLAAGQRRAGALEELLAWQSLSLKGARLVLNAGERPRLDATEAAFNEPHLRLVVNEQGRLLLPGAAVAGLAAAASGASGASPSAPADMGEAALQLSLGRTQVKGGKLDLVDRSVRPNASLALLELNGSLGKFQSGSRELAPLELRGRTASGGAVELLGGLNPAARPVLMDLRAKAADLDLAGQSGQALKYVGQALEKGKAALELDVKVQADGRVEARHKLVLQQLVFADKADAAGAGKPSAALAAALLKDRQGTIELNLPVSGQLSDPQFSLGNALGKAVGAVVARAASAPFATLAGNAGDDLGQVEFEPGTDRLSARGRASVDRLAAALADRPGLRLGLSAQGDGANERLAALREALQGKGLAAERLFLAPPRPRAPGEDEAAGATRVQLSLSAP